ncbi:uncharacterized protein LOC127794761 [Diospyros lotus]|uniref:uncharacterized protein LOC127794761 n=1 Tax=Diospyros lotus TaxID=55363 RepID=UPI00224EF3A2|nr:uncharacterized protein LOC127794761 [Diospyros lotus]
MSRSHPRSKLGDGREDYFSEKEAKNVHWPHNDALVIQAWIDNAEVQRIMVNTGSLVNVMYRACFDQMGLGLEQLSSSPELLYGFTGDVVVPIGNISLLFTIKDVDRQATTLAEFLIVDCPSAYNVMLGRQAMNDLDLVTSTKSLIVKFPTPNGVGTTCLVEELEDIPISETDEERCLKLGRNLAPEVKSQLTNFLKANLDIFAWNHEDMVGIAPEVMSHRLNVDPGYKLVHQKRRPMTIERYATFKEEVDNLLANEFIREAYYQV